jgi:Di-haem cytochrome c peroxidase
MSVPVSKTHTARPLSPRSSALTPRSCLWALLPALLLASCGGPGPQTGSQDVASAPEAAAPQVLQSLGLGDILPLSTLAVPKPTKVLWATVNYNDPAQLAAAVRLGKALFWDQQVGEYKDASKPLMDPANPGQPLMDLNGEPEYQAVTGVACASCHFSAGTDSRRDGTNFRAGSVGVLASLLVSQQQDGDELCQPSGTTLQRTGANTPSAVGAVYSRLQFWDGRAHNNFNGHNPFGDTTGQTSDFQGGEFLDNSSLASQADGPGQQPGRDDLWQPELDDSGQEADRAQTTRHPDGRPERLGVRGLGHGRQAELRQLQRHDQ